MFKKKIFKAFSIFTAVCQMFSCISVYALDVDVGTTAIETVMDTDVGEGEQTVVVLGDDTESDLSVIADDNKEQTNFVFIHIDSSGGCVIINEGGDDEQYIRLVTREAAESDKEFADEDGNAEYIELYNKDGILLSSIPAKNSGNVYACEIETNSVVTLAAKADDGYKVTKYEVTCDEDVEFADDSKSDNISNPLFVDDDKTLTVRFEESSIDEDISVKSVYDANNEDDAAKDDSYDDLSQDLTIGSYINTDAETEPDNDVDKEPDIDSIDIDDSNDSNTDYELDESDETNDSKDKNVSVDADKDSDNVDFEPEQEKVTDIINDTELEDTDIYFDIDVNIEPIPEDVSEGKYRNDDLNDFTTYAVDTPVAVSVSEDTDLCYILAYSFDGIFDGTAPFDSDDSAGNDSSDINGIVRSFDTIDYTLKYTTAIRDSATVGITTAKVMCSFVLPCNPVKAEFNTSAMSWMLDKKTVYSYSDGTESTSYDSNKTCISQKLTGYRLLANSESGNTVPGTGTLSASINVNAAISGDKISPSFTIWMEGNNENEKKTLKNDTFVSAAPKYDLVVKRNGSANLIGYYDAENNTAKSDKENESDKYGRLQTYILALAIQNDSVDKGMKGVEYPSEEDITFDVRISETCNDIDVSYDSEYQPILWDYAADNGTCSKGILGRPMSPFGQNIASTGYWTTSTPFNKGNYNGACYNGGNMNVEQDESDSNLFHITISGMKMDLKDFDFPDRWSGNTSKNINDNTGYFSVMKMQIISHFKSDVTTIENIGIKLEASNLNITSMSGSSVTTEVNNSNNISSVRTTNYPSGSHSKRNFFKTTTGGNLRSTTWSSGDSYAYVGEKISVQGHMVYTGDGYLKATNILQKIDDEAFEIPAGTTKYDKYTRSNSNTVIGDITTLFAAKPDKTGWTDDNEINNTHEENLIYFSSIDDLNNAGYVCVGILYEVRNSKLYPNNSGACLSFDQFVKILPTAKSGQVYMTQNDVRSWRDGTDFSYTNKEYDSSIKAYGLGDSSWKLYDYIDGYTKPTYASYLSYGKAVYKDGTMVSGHTNSYQGGNSVLIVGSKSYVGITVSDQNDSKPKTIYDLDLGERTVKFAVSPSTEISSVNSENQSTDMKDNLKITITLPSGLHYNEQGASLQPESVTENTDGTTTIVWLMNNVTVGKAIEPISFSATIGEEGTANDVKHNDSFTISAKIVSDNDARKVSSGNGNYSETSISVIKLAASAVTKRAETEIVELGNALKFRLRYSNLSDVDAENVRLCDILPYNGDGRGSDFSGTYKLSLLYVIYDNAPRTWDETYTEFSSNNGDNEVRTNTLYISQTENNKTKVDEMLISNTVLDSFDNYSKNLTAINDYAGYKQGLLFSSSNAQDVGASIFLNIGTIYAHEYIDIYMYLIPKDNDTSKQQSGDVYYNNFKQYADNQASIVTSNTVKTNVVKRSISGLVWFDKNRNGIQDDTDVCNDMKVNIYRNYYFGTSQYDKDKVTSQIAGYTVCDAYDVYGNKISSVKTDDNGRYLFENMEKGTYIIVFEGKDGYTITAQCQGDDNSKDSDACLKSDSIVISDINLPAISNMTDYEYNSCYNDVGLVANITVEIQKLDAVTMKKIAGAKLELYNYDDTENNIPKSGAKAIAKWTTESDKSYKIVNQLTIGKKYVLIEKEAPEGYDIADPVVFTVEDIGTKTQTITMLDDYDTHKVIINKKNLDGSLIGGAVLKVTGREDGKTTDITPIEWTSQESNCHVLELRKGRYVLHEVTPPSGYLSADDISFTVNKDGQVIIGSDVVSSIDMVDTEVKACSIKIKKYDSDGKSALPGATFSLKFVSAKYPDITNNADYDRALKPGESVEMTTDVNGEILFENLDQGDYILTETKTVSGHTLMSESINISLPLEMTEKEIKESDGIDVKKAERFDDIYHFYNLTYEVTNSARFVMPMTGANGILTFGLIGFGTLAIIGTGLIVYESMYEKRKRKRLK